MSSSRTTSVRVGIDVGGTFTDTLVADPEGGPLVRAKVPSTPSDPSVGILTGLAQGLQIRGVAMGDVAYFAHGTTVATNALLERRGASVGLITTDGFRDLLEIGRQARPDLYDLQIEKPEPLVPRNLRLQVAERIYYDGSVITPVDMEQLDEAIRLLAHSEVEAVAVCFLHSYVNPVHEERVLARLQEALPNAYLSISSQVNPEFREVERLTTTVVNAYVGPVINRYVGNLKRHLSDRGVGASPYVSQSNGGLISLDEAMRRPVRILLSGPSVGVMGAARVGEEAGFRNLITFDMGGTSADVSLIQDGVPRTATEREVAGYRLRSAMVDIHTVGAGGGSVAWQDAGGLLKVGPHSAGADPGPACYGKGGDQPTVTDAHVVLGSLNSKHLLGGSMPIEAQRSRDAIADLGGRLGLPPRDTASGVVSVVVANMVRAIRLVSVQRGHDPRDYTLVSFGGAGPLHSGWIARELHIPCALVPSSPGLLCAFGLLVSDMRSNLAHTRLVEMEEARPEMLENTFALLRDDGDAWLSREGIPPEQRVFNRFVDMRYRGQNYELTIEAPSDITGPGGMEELARRFHAAHERSYGYAATDEPVQMVTFRMEAVGMAPRIPAQGAPLGSTEAGTAVVGGRRVHLDGRDWDCPIYDREGLDPGNRITGPAVIEQMDTTTLVLPDQRARVDGHRNLLIDTGTG